MDVVAAVGADQESASVVEPGEGALDDPAVASEAGAVFGLATRDLGGDPALAELAPLRLVIVGAVGADPIWSPARPPDSATYRRDAIDERDSAG